MKRSIKDFVSLLIRYKQTKQVSFMHVQKRNKDLVEYYRNAAFDKDIWHDHLSYDTRLFLDAL